MKAFLMVTHLHQRHIYSNGKKGYCYQTSNGLAQTP